MNSGGWLGMFAWGNSLKKHPPIVLNPYNFHCLLPLPLYKLQKESKFILQKVPLLKCVCSQRPSLSYRNTLESFNCPWMEVHGNTSPYHWGKRLKIDIVLLFLILCLHLSSSQHPTITNKVRYHVLILCVHLKCGFSKFISSLCFDSAEGKAALIFENYDYK